MYIYIYICIYIYIYSYLFIYLWAYLVPHSVKIHDFCSGPISVDPICPQPNAAKVFLWDDQKSRAYAFFLLQNYSTISLNYA